jgi:hypothetical protein
MGKRMKDASSKRGSFSELMQGIKEGYERQDKAIRDEQETTSQKQRLVDGAIEGAVNTVINPIAWFLNLFS